MQTEIIRVAGLDEKGISAIKRAAEVIRRGGLVAFPTETVYGLGADATNPEAAVRIYEAKGRPSDNPLIIHIARPSDAEKYAYTSDIYYKLAERFMPGPLTVVLQAKDTVPERTRASLPTVAVRCPKNPIANKLIELSSVAIAAPSANLSGTPSPTRASHVINDMNGRVDVIIDADSSEYGLESTIVSIEGDELVLLRPGKITPDELSEIAPLKIAKAVEEALSESEKPLSPGMKYKHYAPSAPMYLLSGSLENRIGYIKKNIGERRGAIIAHLEDFDAMSESFAEAVVYPFGLASDSDEQAKVLFDILRDADARGIQVIYAPVPRRAGFGLALYNRMIRAAAHNIIDCDGK